MVQFVGLVRGSIFSGDLVSDSIFSSLTMGFWWSDPSNGG